MSLSLPTAVSRKWKTHRSRLARWVQTETTVNYQRALAMVDDAATSGHLPARLDDAGMNRALRSVLHQDVQFDLVGEPVSPCPQIYPTLMAMLLVPVDRQASAAAQRARAAGSKPAAARDVIDPVHLFANHPLTEDGEGEGNPSMSGHAAPWMQVVVQAGQRTGYEFPHLEPTSPDQELLVDDALDYLRATADLDGYRSRLLDATAANPNDVDAYAHLGLLALQQHDGGGDAFYALHSLDEPDRRALLDEALNWFESAVLVGEQALDLVFAGALPADWLGNRPFFRALHGVLLTLWRQERFLSAERVAVAMLWLDPGDRFGAAGLLDLVRRRVRWYPGFTDDDEPRTEAVLRTRRPVHVLPGSLREQLIPSAAGAVSPATVAAVVRRAAALALGGTRAEQHVVVPARDGSRDSVWVRIVARHQRGHSVEPDDYWWDAHTRGAHGDAEPTLFVLVGDAGQILLAQLLRPAELRQYRAAPLPRRDRTAFTTSFVHHRVRYGVDLTSAVDAALNHQGTEDWL